MTSPPRQFPHWCLTASHVLAVGLLAASAVVWSFPVATQFATAVPGNPGDNYGYLWNLWWSRLALSSGAEFWWSTYLLHPIGVDLVNHPHTFLQGFVSAKWLPELTVVQAENLYIVSSLAVNGVAAYVLAFDVTRQSRASLLAAVTFASSPYITTRLMGHYDLLTAWVFPAFAFCVRRMMLRQSWLAGVAAGMVLSVTTYSAYYYVVYLALFFVTYVLAWWSVFTLRVARRAPTPGLRRMRIGLLVILAVVLGFAGWVVESGGGEMSVAALKITARNPQNPLTVAWCLLAGAALTLWRPNLQIHFPPFQDVRRVATPFALMAVAFAVCSAPVIYEAVTLGLAGRYVTPAYHWRSGPPGIDVASLLLGNPFNPLTRDLVSGVYAAIKLDLVECVGWLGVVPMLLLWIRRDTPLPKEARVWIAVFLAAFIWALGPRLVIAGLDAGLPLPQLLARFIPVVSNARIPGRAMVVAYLALGMVLAFKVTSLRGQWQSRMAQWSLVALVALDYLGAPLPMTALGVPRVYHTLAAISDGRPVCELPFGVGDGLGPGVGYQARDILYYATVHGHPLVGGFVSRLPPGTLEHYLATPILGNVLRLSAGEETMPDTPAATLPCSYIVLNVAAASPALLMYVRSVTPLQQLDAADGRILFRVAQ